MFHCGVWFSYMRPHISFKVSKCIKLHLMFSGVKAFSFLKVVKNIFSCELVITFIYSFFCCSFPTTVGEDWKRSVAAHTKKNSFTPLGSHDWAAKKRFKVTGDQFSVSQCVNLGTYGRWRSANLLRLSFLFQQKCLKWEGPGHHNDNLQPIISTGLCVNLHFSSSKLCVLLLSCMLWWCFWDRKEKPGQKTWLSKL